MTSPSASFGSSSAAELRGASRICVYQVEKLSSVQDLLDALKEKPPKEHPMLRSTAVKLSEFYARPPEDISLDLLLGDLETFKDHLQQQRYARNSIRSYSNYVSILVSQAKVLGWQPVASSTPAVWSSLLARAIEVGCDRTLHYFVKKGLEPATVQESDLYEWVGIEVNRGASYAKTKDRAALMRRILVEAGFTSHLALNKVQKAKYGIPLDRFPETLHAEVREVLRWKQDRFVPSRPRGAQIRAVTARGLQSAFCRLYGFLVNVEKAQAITTLRDLVTEQNVGRFIAWCLNERQVNGKGLAVAVGAICAALSRNPKFAYITSPWMPELLKSIPEDSGADALQRKQEKYLPYGVLSTIPHSIRRDRSHVPKDHHKAIALSVRDELLIQWFLLLPWRQRNVRECRIGGPKPNLFHGAIPKMTSITKPEWLQSAEERHGQVEVWQFRFSPDETKTGNDVHCVLPQRLTSLCEEYLAVHRPRLIVGKDPGTLFVNEHGQALTKAMIRNHISRLTLKYGGRIVTPHLFRDIFAYMWLELAPEDYLTLSKLLWHRNIQTTIGIYGRRFNESTALCRMEKILGP